MHAVRLTAAAVAGLLVLAACQTGQSPAPATTPGTGAAAQPVTPSPAAQQPTAQQPGAQPGAPGARRRPDPRQLETGRAGMIARLMPSIAGRENEPAGTVFKNVQVLKDVPAGEFLKLMNAQYGRSLGMNCGGCHVPGEWEKDDRPNKVVARGMQQMVNRLNADIPRIPQIDENPTKVNCGSCHKGTNNPANTLPNPDSAAAATSAPGE